MINLMCSACNCVMCQLRPRMIKLLSVKLSGTIKLDNKNCAELKELMKEHYGANK